MLAALAVTAAAVIAIIFSLPPKLKVGLAKFEVTWNEFSECPDCADESEEVWPTVCVAELDIEARAVRLGKHDAPGNLFCVRWRDAADLANTLSANLPTTRVSPCYETSTWNWRQPPPPPPGRPIKEQ